MASPMKFTYLLAVSLLTTSFSVYAENAVPVYDIEDGKSVGSNNIIRQNDPRPSLIASNQLSSNRQQKEIQSRLNGMQNEIQSLRGQVEELAHQVQILNDQQQLMRVESEKLARNAIEPARNSTPSDTNEVVRNSKATKIRNTASSENRSNNARESITTKNVTKRNEQPKADNQDSDEQTVYQTAYDLIKAKKYNEAIATLQKMLIKYPTGQTAANAHYWLGELYSLTGENDQAATEFRNLIKNYSNNPRVADAQLKLGLIYAAQLKWAEARTLFKKIVTHYPGTATAQQANEQLKQLKQEGH